MRGQPPIVDMSLQLDLLGQGVEFLHSNKPSIVHGDLKVASALSDPDVGCAAVLLPLVLTSGCYSNIAKLLLVLTSGCCDGM